MRDASSFGARLYRAALHFYPRTFRAEFVEQIVMDFDEARADAASTGRTRDLLIFWTQMARDLARSVATQWVRTGWPVIAAIAVAGSSVQISALMSVWQPNALPMPDLSEEEDAIVLVMLAAVVVVVIAATIVSTIWLSHSVRRRSRR